jgi:acyl-homoserine lactone acylase PvdQ
MMVHFRSLATFCVCVFVSVSGWMAQAADLPGTGPDDGKTVVYRDTWGVPHIYAPSVEAGLYAMGWAQAEDRPEELLKNFMRAMGESARFEGPGGVRTDAVVRMFDHYGTAKRLADRIRPEVRQHLKAFVRGVNDWYLEHPDDIPAWWGNREVDEFMAVAFARLFLYGWSIDDAFDDLQRGGVAPGFDETSRASNEWAVSPSRSAAGAAILLIDPHLSWWGPSRFWEFRIHAGALHGSGFTLPGFPYVGLGHNANLAWAMTTGGPDTADVYALTLHPDDPTKYKYDDEWRELTARDITIEVRDRDPHKMTLYASHHGPIVALRGGKAYAAKTAYADCVQINEAWYELNFAKDYRGAVRAMETRQLFPQNVMVADTSGNIYYQRTGRVPVRPDGYDWTRPVDGSTSATEWQGTHPASDHVQVLNPPLGYMQNCNIPPNTMAAESPFDLEDVPFYLVTNKSYEPNQRGARAVELLHADDSVTVQEAIAYALDVHPYGVERWLKVLKDADAKFGEPHRANPDYVAGIEDLVNWDGEMRRDSAGALKYYYWRSQLIEDHGGDAIRSASRRIDFLQASLGRTPPPIELNDDEYQGALDSLDKAMAALKEDFGSLSATFGDKFRVGRDDVSWPLGGGSLSEVGMRVLRSVSYERERPDHTRWGRAGQTSTQIVVLTKPIQSWTGPPVGQSDRPESPHYRDQAEKLFSPRRLKPTWWQPAELAEHIESRHVLPKAE